MDTVISWVISKFKDYVIRNWPTTAAGVIGSLITLVPALAPFREAILTFTVALVGLLAKSAGTTGTVAQPREPVPDGVTQLVTEPAAAENGSEDSKG